MKTILKKIKKIVIVIILLDIFFIICHTIKNAVIINDLNNRAQKYKDSTNYHMTIITMDNSGAKIVTEVYRKDDKKAVFLKREANSEITKIATYSDGTNCHSFTEANGQKIVNLNANILEIHPSSGIEVESGLELLIASARSHISRRLKQSVECYNIQNIRTSSTLDAGDSTYLIEVNTGLLFTTKDNTGSSRRTYEFNGVDSSVFVEPNISEYTMQQ